MNKYTRVKSACFVITVTMSIICALSPILFLTFNELYKISYSLLGLLVLINFASQLLIDFICAFFSYKFNLEKVIKIIPVLGAVGLSLYALSPYLFPNNIYLGLVLGTIIFSASSGFAEVYLTPVVAKIPSDNPEREISKLHAFFPYGEVGFIILATLYLHFVGTENWQWLALGSAIVPLIACVLFMGQTIPCLEDSNEVVSIGGLVKTKGVWLCVFAIFLGGMMECTMGQWSSSYIEQVLGIPKALGDVFGFALFALMMGLVRALYAKRGKNILKTLVLGSIGTLICYAVAVFSPIPLLGLVACVLTGLTASMLWPGCLVVSAERFPSAGVFMYAIMAAGGDMGASVGPQLVGLVTDMVAVSPWGIELAKKLLLSPEQLGMRCGMLLIVCFSLIAVFVFLFVAKTQNKSRQVSLSQSSQQVEYDK